MQQANYPLLTDLADTTLTYADVALTGTATGPAQGVCADGVYAAAGGSDIRTPNIGTLDTDDFQLEVDFQVAAFGAPARPILIGGDGWRWIGFQVQLDGTLGILHNNANSVWSTTVITLGTYYTGMIKYELGEVELWLDGNLILSDTIGPLTTGNDHCFTCNNWSNGSNHNGCLRNLVISNDTTLGAGPSSIGTNYCGPAVPNSSGSPGSISASGVNTAASNNLTLTASNLPNNQFGIFVTSRTQGFSMGAGGTSNGDICLGGVIGRYNLQNQILSSGSTGTISLPLDLTQTPEGAAFVAISMGQTWNFQAWHRDSVGLGSNFTDGLEIMFQ